MKFITRVYNNFELNKNTNASIIKRSSEDRLLNEIKYYESLPNELLIYFPRLLNSSKKQFNYELELEYYGYGNLGNKLISEDFDLNFWKQSFDFIFKYLNYCTNFKKTATIEDSTLMYVTKTEREYEKLFTDFNFFKDFRNFKYFTLNNKSIKCFYDIWPKIKDYLINNHTVSQFNIIHGDLCFSNILYGINPITEDIVLKFIDPRGLFGESESYGDFYYDLAKISHSINGGYEYFINDKFTIKNEGASFYLTYSNQNKDAVNILFKEYINTLGFSFVKIKIIEGLIYIGMCARHYDSLDRQKAMFLTGLKILNEVYDDL